MAVLFILPKALSNINIPITYEKPVVNPYGTYGTATGVPDP